MPNFRTRLAWLAAPIAVLAASPYALAQVVAAPDPQLKETGERLDLKPAFELRLARESTGVLPVFVQGARSVAKPAGS